MKVFFRSLEFHHFYQSKAVQSLLACSSIYVMLFVLMKIEQSECTSKAI